MNNSLFLNFFLFSFIEFPVQLISILELVNLDKIIDPYFLQDIFERKKI